MWYSRIKVAISKQTAEDMLHLLAQAPVSTDSTSSPVLHDPLLFGQPILNAFAKVADILRRAVQPAPPPAVLLTPQAPIPTVPPVTPVAPSGSTIPIVVLPPSETEAAPLPRVQTAPVVPLPRVQTKSPPLHQVVLRTPLLQRKSPRARLSRLHFDSRTHQRIPTLLAQSVQHDPTISGKMLNPITGKNETMDSLLRGSDSKIWTRSLSNEWGRCMQGVGKNRPASERIIGNDTMFFIKPSQVPSGRKVTYATHVCTMRPGKSEVHRVRMAVGGDRLDAYQDVRSPAVGVTDTKLHLNSVISDAARGARYQRFRRKGTIVHT